MLCRDGIVCMVRLSALSSLARKRGYFIASYSVYLFLESRTIAPKCQRNSHRFFLSHRYSSSYLAESWLLKSRKARFFGSVPIRASRLKMGQSPTGKVKHYLLNLHFNHFRSANRHSYLILLIICRRSTSILRIIILCMVHPFFRYS